MSDENHSVVKQTGELKFPLFDYLLKTYVNPLAPNSHLRLIMILSELFEDGSRETVTRGGVIEFQPALSLTQAFADDLRRTKVI